jgi:thiamine biosynthesis protein ThiC
MASCIDGFRQKISLSSRNIRISFRKLENFCYKHFSNVSTVRLKHFAQETLGDSLLAAVLLAERDDLEVAEFLAKVEVWLNLLSKERQ